MNTATNTLLNDPWSGIVPGVFGFVFSYEENFAHHIPGMDFLDVGYKYTARKNIESISRLHVIDARLEKPSEELLIHAESSSPFTGVQEHLAQSAFTYTLTDRNAYAFHSFVQGIFAILSPLDLSSFEGVVATLQAKGFGKSAARLIDLRFADDLEEGDKPLSLESARGFVKLMCNFQKLGEPMIGIFPRGTLAVEWRIADDKHLLVQPLDGERATFAFIGPADSESGSRYRLNGRGTIAKVIDTLQRESVERWAG